MRKQLYCSKTDSDAYLLATFVFMLAAEYIMHSVLELRVVGHKNGTHHKLFVKVDLFFYILYTRIIK